MIQGESYTVHIGNNLDILPTLADNSVDSIVTDPPYELGFMGKKWDSSGIAYSVELWRECLRILKPGGHLLSFGGTRTWHRVAVGIEDAGFEVRDSIAWMYGSGFPKSLDVSKAIDKAAGAEREVIGTKIASPKGISGAEQRSDSAAGAYGGEAKEIDITAPSTPEAKQWEGWGTALKPAFEPIVVARKPLIATVAENVLTHGTGALNIDGSRIGTLDGKPVYSYPNGAGGHRFKFDSAPNVAVPKENTQGRWPSNVILDEYTAELLDEQSGISGGGKLRQGVVRTRNNGIGLGSNENRDGIANSPDCYGDTGGASRFFYVAKASKRDRNEGLEELETKAAGSLNMRTDSHSLANGMETKPAQNFHPTVKPTQLMRYLVKLVTPPGGTVLDPFTGSGSTGKAAILEGFRFIGCELTQDYIPIIEGRLKHAESIAAEAKEKKDEALF
jgi:site-specific DNA-methyltransferase (adenine-specific)